MTISNKTVFLCDPKSGGRMCIFGALIKTDAQTTAIQYLDDDHMPQLLRFSIDSWPPTDDDIKRAEVTLMLLKSTMTRRGAP